MKRLTLLLLSLIATLTLGAQNIKVQAPNLVEVGEQFNVTFIIEGEDSPSDFSWSEGNDFSLVWGPQSGTSTSISIINGKRSKSVQRTYTYVLMAKNAGNFQLPTASAILNGKTIYSVAAKIDVVSGAVTQQGQPSTQSSSTQSSSQKTEQGGQVSSDDIFMKLSISKNKVVVGETMSATLKLYTRTSISGFDEVKFPTFTGFWSQESFAPTSLEFKRENVNGTIYDAAVIRSYTLIPQQTGELTIDPAELVCLVNVRNVQNSSNSIFDSFFMDDYKTVRKRVATSSFKVKVSPLPAGAPASFGGGVGTFKMTAKLSTDSLRAHDAASLKVTVTGNGNVALLEAPKLSFPPDFEVYDVRTTDVPSGKQFEYPFIPRSHGEFTIGPVEYAYYDNATGRYVSLKSEAFNVKVGKGAENASSGAGQIVVSNNRKDVKNLASDIKFISTADSSFSEEGRFFVGSAGFWIVALLMLLASAVAYFAIGKVQNNRHDVALSRRKVATKMAKKRLAAAGEYLQKNLYTAFYEELHKALLGFVSDKMNMDLSEMSKENISAKLIEAGVKEGVASELTGLLDACEYARYAPDSGHDAMNAHFESALNVISEIDDSMKKGKIKVGKIVAVLMMLMISFPGMAQNYPDSLWNAGKQAYMDGNWNRACDSWSSIVSAGVVSADLYYNLGCAYYKAGNLSNSILSYERALKLDPSYSDARMNLDFVNSLIQDKIESVPEFFLKAWMRKISYWLGSNAWAALFFVFLAAVMAGALLFLRAGSSGLRKTGFFAGIASLILAIFCISFAFSQKNAYFEANTAIVMNPVTSVKSSPTGGENVDLFILHEGTKVKLKDSVGNWSKIELADGRQGWILTNDIEVI